MCSTSRGPCKWFALSRSHRRHSATQETTSQWPLVKPPTDMQSPLSYDAVQALRAIREFMESRATYQDVEGLSMVSEVDALKKYVQEFLRHYVKTVPV